MANFYILTLGCQMNKNDSERVASLLSSLGMSEVDKADRADVIVLNTCSVRDSAEARVYGFVDQWIGLKKNNPNLLIAVTGCMPGRDKDGKLRQKLRGVDLFFAIEELPLLPGWLKGLKQKDLGEFNDQTESDYLKILPKRINKFQAFITIQIGCNNFCTFCVVPYSRGREQNRRVVEIITEAKVAADSGAKEITLLGQVVNNYKVKNAEEFNKNNIFKGKDDFAALLWELNQINGIERIHFTAPDPQYFNDFQIQALGLPKQINFLHIPAQSGDNEVLHKMNRKYTREYFINLIKKIRLAQPDIAIGTDLIVGFSGETAGQFENTMDLCRECDFDIAYQAVYSERSGTVAAKAFEDDVSSIEKKCRWEAVQNLMEQSVYRKNQKYQDKIVEVLVDSMSKGKCSGNTNEMKLCQFIGGPDLIGKIVRVKITDPQMWVLRGEKVE